MFIILSIMIYLYTCIFYTSCKPDLYSPTLVIFKFGGERVKSHHWITKNNCADCVQHHFSSHLNVLLKLVQHLKKKRGGGGCLELHLQQ